MLNLRPYQKEALTSVKKSFKSKIHKQLLVLPTGAGKTCLFIAITQHYKRKTLILAHRNELIVQAYEKFKAFYPAADIGIYQGNQHNLDHQVIVSSIQTCNKRIQQLKEKGFKLFIIDEAHHAISDTYTNIISKLGFLNDHRKLLIGVTATPQRADNKALADIFQEITYSISIDTLIKEKYLSPVTARRILTDFKLTGIATTMGDFAVGELAQAVNIPERNTFIVSKWKQHALNRKTIVFCVDVKHCQDLADEFNKQDILTAAVWGNMNPELRKQIIDDFKLGKITVVTSCGILTEGFDEPSVSCIVMARPTKSTGLYTQCIGRGLRIDENQNATKKDCLVLDFTDKHHNLNSIISLANVMLNVPVIVDDNQIKKKAPNLTPKRKTIRSDMSIDREFNLLAAPKFVWIFSGITNSEWSLSDDNKNEIVFHKINDTYTANVYFENGDIIPLVIESFSFQDCKRFCEQWAQNNLLITYADANSSWTAQSKLMKATLGQENFLRMYKAYKPRMNKATACLEIRKIIAQSKRNQRRSNNHIAKNNTNNLLTQNQSYSQR